jgi:replicative DNA helicase
VNAAVPPFSLDAEEHVTAACIISGRARETVSEHLTPEHLVIGSLRDILAACLEAHDRGDPVDPLLLTERLPNHQARIAELVALGLPTTNVEHHVRIVRDYHTRRELIRIGQNIARDGWEPQDSIQAALERAETAVYEVTTQTEQGELRHVSGTLSHTFEQLARPGGEITGTPTGLADLDAITAGMQPGNLVVVAARPGQGKSALALQAALHNAVDRNTTTALFTLEMSAEEINQRSLAVLSHVPLMRIRRRLGLTDTNRHDLHQAGERLQRAPLYLDDTVAARTVDIRARARRLKARQPDLALIVVDYLQLMIHDGSNRENREQQVAKISRGLKLLARELGVPVMALSQLNRNVEHRGPAARPMLADLRDSGAVEQDADVVIFIHRPKDGADNTADLIVSKHRNGPTGETPVTWLKKIATFANHQQEGA